MKTESRYRKMGMFDYNTLTVKFGGEKSTPQNIFTAKAVKVPEYTVVSYEIEDLGDGWYGTRKVRVERKYDNTYLLFRDEQCIGWMMPPSVMYNDTKSELHPLEVAPVEIINYLNQLIKQTNQHESYNN